MRLAFVTSIALIVTSAVPALAGVNWIAGSWPDALAAAQTSHKPIMALFFRPGCGHCATQDTTLASPEVLAYSEKFVAVRFDVDGAVGKEMAKRFKVIGSPNTLFF